MNKILVYLAIGLARLLVLLPYRVQLKLGVGLGLLTMICLPSRVHIVDVNLGLCFPEKSDQERHALRVASFKSLGKGFMEAIMAWFMSDHRFANIPFTWKGFENFEAACAHGQGVLAIGGHFDCLELIARKVGQKVTASLVYKKSRNLAFDQLVYSRRKTYITKLISHENMRAMVRSLQQKEILWYAPDQDFGRPRSVFVPFFHENAATLIGSSILTQLGKAVALPAFFHRKPNVEGYEFVTLPLLEHFPSGDDKADAVRFNILLADYIRTAPEQYVWAHRRFKTRPPGEASVY